MARKLIEFGEVEREERQHGNGKSSISEQHRTYRVLLPKNRVEGSSLSKQEGDSLFKLIEKYDLQVSEAFLYDTDTSSSLPVPAKILSEDTGLHVAEVAGILGTYWYSAKVHVHSTCDHKTWRGKPLRIELVGGVEYGCPCRVFVFG